MSLKLISPICRFLPVSSHAEESESDEAQGTLGVELEWTGILGSIKSTSLIYIERPKRKISRDAGGSWQYYT